MSESDLPLGDVLSVTHDRLVSRDHIGGVYRVCDFMTGVANFTHQLPRVSEQVAPAILAQHPWLSTITVPDWDMDGLSKDEAKAVVYGWLDGVEAEHGATVRLMPLTDYDAPDAIEEACDIVGAENVYVFDPGAES